MIVQWPWPPLALAVAGVSFMNAFTPLVSRLKHQACTWEWHGIGPCVLPCQTLGELFRKITQPCDRSTTDPRGRTATSRARHRAAPRGIARREDPALVELMDELFSDAHRADTAGMLIAWNAQWGVWAGEKKEKGFLVLEACSTLLKFQVSYGKPKCGSRIFAPASGIAELA